MTRDTATPTERTAASSTTTALGRTARRLALATGGVLVAVTSTASATGHHHGGGGTGAGTWGFGVGGGMWLWGLLWMGVLFAVLALAARALFDWERDTDQPQPERSPQDVLRERYARGDLDDDEFERRRQTLRSDE